MELKTRYFNSDYYRTGFSFLAIYFYRPYIDPTLTLHRSHIDPTLNLFFSTLLRKSWNYIPLAPPHFYCFPSTTTTTTTTFVSFSNFGETPVWYNSLIRIDNKPIHYRNWSSVGIYFVSDLLEEESQFSTFCTFKEKFVIKAHFLQYRGVIWSISNLKRRNHCPQMESAKTDTKSLLSSEAFCKLAYKIKRLYPL